MVNQKRLEAAILRYRDAAHGRDIAISCYMESSPTWVYRLFKWNSSSYNKNLVKTVVALHLLITFFEPSSLSLLKSSGPKTYQVIWEFLCIAVELQDAVIRTILLSLSLGVKNTVENIRAKLVDQIILIFVIVAVFIDLILTSTMSFSFEYYIPIKVLIVILEIVEVR
jgi:hypothetical protein